MGVRVRGGGDEVEEDVLGAGRVLEDREDGSHGAAEVGRVKCHCHVDGRWGAHVGDGRDLGAVWGVVEFGCFSKLRCSTSIGIGRAEN